jgi:hypothetical protein
MAMNILDTMQKTLPNRNAVKQDRIAMSGDVAGMRIPPAVLSPEWRLVSPGSPIEPEPALLPTASVTALTDMAVKRAGRLAASCSGLPATSRTVSRPFSAFHQRDSRDCLSHGCRQTRRIGLAGFQPGHGTAKAYSRGK